MRWNLTIFREEGGANGEISSEKKKRKRLYKEEQAEGSPEFEMEQRPDNSLVGWLFGDGLWW
jgi:hypothetical protein